LSSSARRNSSTRRARGGSDHQAAPWEAVVPDDSPYTTGGIGLLGTAPSQYALADCDTLIIAGSSFPYLEFYPKPGNAKTVQVDLDPVRIGLRHPADVGLVGDCRDVLNALLPLVQTKEDRVFGAGSKNMKDWNRFDGNRRPPNGHAE
jgi:thiamine pyrophosphate-dependent acetolactate synthase large subunit-like protein